ncbi:hypothetical protein MGU_05527 [Metarhizium guizhouense ARSEF 977]|uniref:Uncharacterized protein n=1 Tax=Metarhizium guizhouense (strain ARSEF 977) TaxID=1276136 RepID=A0A0B4GK72_METGA|nr:hypothetical protein MGU_05527 [Metarhizium guizhouense ARSEF 977]
MFKDHWQGRWNGSLIQAIEATAKFPLKLTRQAMTYLVVVNCWIISGIRDMSPSSLQQTSSLQHRGAFVTEDEVNASLQPPTVSPSPSSPQAADVRSPSASWPYKSTARRQDSHGFQAHRHRPSAGSNTTSLRQPPSSNQPPRFSVEDQAYLRGRLPLRQRVSARTVINHFRRLPLLYQDLAEGCRAHLSHLPPGARELEKRQRMAELAQRLADRYMRFRLILPRSYIDVTLARWQGELSHTSRFWENTLEEIEATQKANNSWSIARLWVLRFTVQSSLVAVAYNMLPTPGKFVILIANCLACVWSTTVMCETLHSQYIEMKSDEQKLHDLLGGRRG